MSATKRILQYIDLKKISKYRFYKETGLSNGFLDKSENIGSDKCEIILTHYPDLNPEWLLTGVGEMLKIGNIHSSEIHHLPRKSTPFYDIIVSAGTLGLIATENSIIEPKGYCDLEMFIGCEAILPVVGMSMNPIISPGDYIGVKRIIYGDLSFLRTDYIYLIITCEDRMIKFIEQCDDANYIICKSPNYAPFKVLKDDILELHLVKAVSKSLM